VYVKALQQQDSRAFDRSVPDELIPFINAHTGQGLFVVHNCMNHSCDNNAETTFRHGDRYQRSAIAPTATLEPSSDRGQDS
jgi:hypothetical protein